MIVGEEQIKLLKRTLRREKEARKQAEQILEIKSTELYELTQSISKSKDELQVLLNEKNSELSGLIQRIIDPYVLVDLKGNIIKYNEAADNLLNIQNKLEQASTLNLIHVIEPKDRDRLADAFVEMVQNGYVKDVDFSIHQENGRTLYFQVNAAVLYDSNQNPKAAQGIARDVTKLKLLEKQKDQLLTELVQRNEEINEYTHVVSHDLKSPLNGINSLVTWIKEEYNDLYNDEAKELFLMIEKSITKMDGLITGIIKYARADVEHEEKESINLKSMIEEIYFQVNPRKTFELIFETEMPTIFTYRNKLEQVILNLLANAIKFTPDNKGKIIWACVEKTDKFEISIQDFGIGIEEKYFEKIFKVFEYLEEREDSTGIGLAIVKKVVHALGGEISLESKLGKGSKFYFTIPKA